MQVLPAVESALRAGRPVVALESTVLTHGLPRPENLRLARRLESIVADHGAVPATVGVVAGQAYVGLDDPALAQLAMRPDAVKAGRRDLAVVCAAEGWAGTTVAATAHLAARAGIRVFATGGLGGVHRGARDTWDESADLTALASTRIVVVCAGVKSILDVGATLERLESLGVTVLGYGSDMFAGFYRSSSGHVAPSRVDSAEQVAEVVRAADALGTSGSAILVAAPLPEDEQMDGDVHDAALRSALEAAAAAEIIGKDVTPFLLAHFHEGTGGESVAVNERILERNAALAARIATALCAADAP